MPKMKKWNVHEPDGEKKEIILKKKKKKGENENKCFLHVYFFRYLFSVNIENACWSQPNIGKHLVS